VASWAVRTETLLVIGSAQVRLVLGVTVHRPELFETVGELAFVSVFADPLVLVGTAHFRLVPRAGLLLLCGIIVEFGGFDQLLGRCLVV